MPSCCDSLNFMTPTADRCPLSTPRHPHSGGLFTETQACPVAVLGVVASSVWDGESGKWQSGNSGGTIDTSVCSLSITRVARTRRWGGSSREKPQHFIRLPQDYRKTDSHYRCYCGISRKCNPDPAGFPWDYTAPTPMQHCSVHPCTTPSVTVQMAFARSRMCRPRTTAGVRQQLQLLVGGEYQSALHFHY